MNTQIAQKAIERVAMLHGVSAGEVTAQIKAAMELAAIQSEHDPMAQAHWEKMQSQEGNTAPADLVAYIARQISNSAET